MGQDRNLESVVLFQLDRANKIAKLYSQQEIDRLELGITVEQWVLLKMIHEEGPLTQKELAELSLRDPASITRTMRLLTAKGLVQREPDAVDKRQYNVVLTIGGEAFVKHNMEWVKTHRQKSVEGFSETEIKQFHSFLLRLQRNMQP